MHSKCADAPAGHCLWFSLTPFNMSNISNYFTSGNFVNSVVQGESAQMYSLAMASTAGLFIYLS